MERCATFASMRLSLFLYGLLCLLFSPSLFGQIQVKQGMASVQLVENPSVKALYASEEVPFKLIRQKNFTAPYTIRHALENKRALWLEFRVKNLDSQYTDYYLYNYFPYCTVYQETDTGWLVLKGGNLLPLKERDNRKADLFTYLQVAPLQTAQFYVRLQSGSLHDENDYPEIGDRLFYYRLLTEWQAYNHPSTVFSLIYFSSITIIFFFTLILYLSLKERTYLYYLLYLFFQIVYSLIIYARSSLSLLNFSLYFPQIGYVTNESVQFLFIGFYILFIFHLLNISRNTLLGKVITGLAWLCFVYAAFALFYFIFFPSPEGRLLLFNVIRLIVLPVNLLLVIWIIAKIRHPLIPYFIVAHLFFFAGSVLSVITSFREWNQDPNSIFFFRNSLNTIFQAGLLGEVFCFSFALAHRTRLIQKEKEQHNLAYIRQLKENERIQEQMNKELDEKVNQKTEELIHAYSTMEMEREQEMKKEFSRQINEMEMMALRTQMNPHFLFNSMNAMKHLIMTNRPEDAMHYLDDFSILLRSVLNNSRRETITVEDELEILELYLSLEARRLKDHFHYRIMVDQKELLSQYPIPGLLLQPFVENAIWHGLSPSNKEDKLLTVRFDTRQELVISIRDNGIGRAAAKEMRKGSGSIHQSMGVQITQDRLALFNHTHEQKIYLKTTDLMEHGHPSGTLVTFTYSNEQP